MCGDSGGRPDGLEGSQFAGSNSGEKKGDAHLSLGFFGRPRGMPRLARQVFSGVPHHVTQRGNRRENVFFSDADRQAYLEWLAEY
jgi:putative transposase